MLLVATLADVRLALGNEEAEEAARGTFQPHEVTASVFLNTGLDLEEQQCVQCTLRYSYSVNFLLQACCSRTEEEGQNGPQQGRCP